MNPLNDLLHLFVPPECPVCGARLKDGEHAFCNRCRSEAPLTGYAAEADNPVFRRFWGIVPVERACSFMFFVGGSGWRNAVHDFKYRGEWRLAQESGEWMGGELLRSGLYNSVDIVVPVPLHPLKLLKRGYNQSEYIARGVADVMQKPVSVGNLVRVRHNPSQALKPFHERWNNVSGIFALRHSELLQGRHILLVDDVLTTAATISSCAEAIKAAVPDCRISIATFAVAHDQL